jgi:hypothetical protein
MVVAVGRKKAQTENGESRFPVTRHWFLPGGKGISVFRVPCPVILSFGAGRSKAAFSGGQSLEQSVVVNPGGCSVCSLK